MQLPETGHDPVLLAECMEWLAPAPGKTFVDCTLGRGGHSAAIAPLLSPGGTLIGLDYDPRNLEYAGARVRKILETPPREMPVGMPHVEALPGEGASGAGESLAPSPATTPTTLRLFHANFAEIEAAMKAAGIAQVDGILADLGISTNQLFEEAYGLSFTNNVPLDMRLDPRQRLSAADIVNRWPEQKIADTLYQMADERFSRRIARKIVEVRRGSPINTTEHLADLVRSCIPPVRVRDRSTAIDPATRTFLALRMAVNGEMDNLDRLLAVSPKLLRPGGRIAIISFHSTEDRRVKQAFRSAEQTGQLKVLTSRPLIPSDNETANNPRARSAKLRVAEKA